ncbi:F-box domain-containing protein [Mycena sanguinolenta]|uniref:F-box domain-containing protein n=1 Tax=Mycena sanguinolenta TaxID=230812 RepID=A0A8H6Y3M2_9AGAR|nr:F-box domain-containing protein [Mycena sanguinolenta]
MQFQQLPEDVLRSIFSFCDIRTVVSMSGTNKYFHRLSTDKSVWVDLVHNLRRRGFVDRLSLSDIQSYSQGDLVGLVKGLLLGPSSWTTTTSDSQTFVRAPTKYTIHPSITPSNANLLPGGEYIICYSDVSQTLECWSVRCDKLVWAYDKKGSQSTISGYDAEVIDEGAGANIVVCEWDGSSAPIRLEIVKLDFASGTSTRLFVYGSPPGSSFIAPKLCGNIVFVDILAGSGPRGLTSRLINWKTQVHLELAFSKTSQTYQFNIILIPNYILVLIAPFLSGPEIIILRISAFSSHWWAIATHPTPAIVYSADLESILHEKITFPDELLFADWWTHTVHAYESPIEEGTFRVWIVMTNDSESSGLGFCVARGADPGRTCSSNSLRARPTVSVAEAVWAGTQHAPYYEVARHGHDTPALICAICATHSSRIAGLHEFGCGACLYLIGFSPQAVPPRGAGSSGAAAPALAPMPCRIRFTYI